MSEHGPQKQPYTVRQIEAAVKQAKTAMIEPRMEMQQIIRIIEGTAASAITDLYGDRHTEYSPGCGLCEAWDLLDKLIRKLKEGNGDV